MKKEAADVLFMAPLLGVTNCIYRSTYSRFFSGYDKAIAPFIASCSAKTINPKLFRDILPERNQINFKLIPQILSKDADDFIVMVKAMHDLGYDHINWNLGCPFVMVRKKMRGSGLLSHPDVIRSFLDKVLPNIPAKLSVKVRLGCENNTELLTLMPIFDPYPLEEITIHPRTALQMYEGSVDLSAFNDCLKITNHKIVFNGDIDSLETFNDLKQRFTKVSGWMIGRGGVADPFLPDKILGENFRSSEEKNRHMHAFHNALLSAYSQELSGPGHILDKMKQIWKFWRRSFVQGEPLFLKISRIKRIDDYSRVVNLFFEGLPHFVS